MTGVRIVLIDDKPAFVEKMAQSVRSAALSAGVRTEFFKIAESDSEPAGRKMNATLTGLLKELSQLRQGESERKDLTENLETAHLVFVDYDLRGTALEEGLITGERVAQLIRQFMSAGPVVSVDRREMRFFDLIHRRPSGTNADFMLHWEDLAVRSLWGGQPRAYDPWYWPNLVETGTNYQKRVKFVSSNYTDPVARSLGVPEDVEAILPGEDPRLELDFREASFAKVAEASIPPKESKAVMDDCRHRVAASAVGVWLQSGVLPPQDILIDAPHLVRHCPGLLRGKPIASNLAKLTAKRAGAAVPLDPEKLKRHRFRHEFWLDRPAWWLSGILQDRGIRDIAEPWNKKPLGVEFAEDASRFHRPSDLAPYESEGFFATRYVRGSKTFSGIQYSPSSRLAT